MLLGLGGLGYDLLKALFVVQHFHGCTGGVHRSEVPFNVVSLKNKSTSPLLHVSAPPPPPLSFFLLWLGGLNRWTKPPSMQLLFCDSLGKCIQIQSDLPLVLL